jgi:hypothetical protein
MQLSLASASRSQDETTIQPAAAPATPSVEQIALPTTQDQLEVALRSNQQLRRETQLIASAWYDQNQRRVYEDASAPRSRPLPEPRSFLGKQRRVVEDVMIGKSSP